MCLIYKSSLYLILGPSQFYTYSNVQHSKRLQKLFVKPTQ